VINPEGGGVVKTAPSSVRTRPRLADISMRKQLKDIANFRTGYQFRGRFEPDPKGAVSVVQIQNLDEDRRLSSKGLDRTGLVKSIDPYRVDLGDVLFLSRGHRLFGTPIDEPLADTIATNYFFILTPTTDEVRHKYLSWYLNQPLFQAELRPFVRGSHMPLVSKADLAGQWIEIPPLATQDAIIALDEFYRREQGIMVEIRKKRAELIQTVSINAARRKR